MTDAPRRPTASSISAVLHRAGYRPVQTRLREGVHVSSSRYGVSVSMQWNSRSMNRAVAIDVADLLRRAGYSVEIVGQGEAVSVRP